MSDDQALELLHGDVHEMKAKICEVRERVDVLEGWFLRIEAQLDAVGDRIARILHKIAMTERGRY